LCILISQINVNGYITLSYTSGDYVPYQFPTVQNRIAVFFADVTWVCGSNRIVGDLWTRLTNGKYNLLAYILQYLLAYPLTS